MAGEETLKPRGAEYKLPSNGLVEFFPPYLANLIMETGGPKGPLGLQFVAQPELERFHANDGVQDSLIEDENEVAPGLVYKYKAHIASDGTILDPGRALFTITRNCAAYCRFCTRGREVGIPAGLEGAGKGALAHTPHLSIEQINESLAFIAHEPGLDETIVSGGDPLTVRPEVLEYLFGRLRSLQDSGKLKVVRIGTRVPVHNPFLLKDVHFAAIAQLKNPYMMIHINHPAEMTPEMLESINRIRRECAARDSYASVLSQTVLLKGVNDNVDTLKALFRKMAAEGIRPYYIYQNDPVYWAQHMTVKLWDAIQLYRNLRTDGKNFSMSGVADTEQFVVDSPGGYGKVPIPKAGFDVNWEQGFTDFHGNHYKLDYAPE